MIEAAQVDTFDAKPFTEHTQKVQGRRTRQDSKRSMRRAERDVARENARRDKRDERVAW